MEDFKNGRETQEINPAQLQRTLGLAERLLASLQEEVSGVGSQMISGLENIIKALRRPESEGGPDVITAQIEVNRPMVSGAPEAKDLVTMINGLKKIETVK